MYNLRPTKMQIVTFTRENISMYTQRLEEDFVMPGLSRKKTGMLYGPPNIGKSYLLQSIAYEVATSKPLVGLIDTKRQKPQRVLFICQEDRIEGFMSRANVQVRYKGYFGDREMDLLSKNLHLSELPNALISRTHNDPICAQQVIELIEEATGFDLVIIDTARKVMGNAREVEEDKLLEVALDTVAERANCAILLSHHITKLQADRNQSTKVFLNATGGSGLTSTQATSKYHLALFYGDHVGESKLWHSKDNFVPRHMLITESNPIIFKQNELQLFINPNLGKDEQSTDETVPANSEPVNSHKSQAPEKESQDSNISTVISEIEAKDEKPLLEADPHVEIIHREVIEDQKLVKMLSERNNRNGGINVKHIQVDGDNQSSKGGGLFSPTKDDNY